MQRIRSHWFGFLGSLLIAVALACSGQVPTATAVPTDTSAPPTVAPTATTPPTEAPPPTAAPDLAATQQVEGRLKLLQSYADKGYIETTQGEFEDILDFQEEWAQLGWYQWWYIHDTPTDYGNLVFQGHFKWSTATGTPEISGCGILFGIQPNEDHYAVFIDKSRIAFLMSRGSNVYEVGKTSGSGRVKVQEPYEADVAVIVQGKTGYVIVDGTPTKYTLSADQSSMGEFALSVLSGTNKDYGTRCEITNAYIWQPSQ